MINIGIDIMGGDLAPEATLEGSLKAISRLNANTCLHLIGPEETIKAYFESQKIATAENWKIVNASQTIGMDENPVKALQQKPDSSMAIGFALMGRGILQGFASAGNSGAMMVAAMHALKPIEGVTRPCAISAFPQKGNSYNILVDVGINVDAKPEMFLQFAKLGVVYAQEVYHIKNPRVGLLNTGTEKHKGSLLYQKAHDILSNSKEITFAGNIEAREFYENTVDVTVCDGFTGNVFLKQAEGFYKLLQYREIRDPFLDRFNYELYGGTPVLGVNGNVILGHGASSALAITNMILATEKVAQAKLSEHITKAFKN